MARNVERVIVKENNEPDPASAVNGIIFVLVEIILVTLLLRLILRMFSANPNNSFVNLVYSLSDVFMMPFRGIFPTTAAEGFVFEWSVLVAMFVYALIGWLLTLLFRALTPRS